MQISWIDSGEILKLTSIRKYDLKLGERLAQRVKPQAISDDEFLKQLAGQGCRYGIVGIAEDIGPRANLGRAGSDAAWAAFLQAFVNLQANRFVAEHKIALLGDVTVTDLMDRSKQAGVTPEQLRNLCAQIDQRVGEVIAKVVSHGIEPIVIGGGQNNSLPIIEGAVKGHAASKSISILNIDGHADFRQLEGRHSGNPFSYAHSRGLIEHYAILGLFELFNSEEMLSRLQAAGAHYRTFEQIFIRREITLDAALAELIVELQKRGKKVGLEHDLDIIANMPSSAKVPFGFTAEHSGFAIYQSASQLDCLYLHLPEGAPCHGPDGVRMVGMTLAWLVQQYITGREAFKQR